MAEKGFNKKPKKKRKRKKEISINNNNKTQRNLIRRWWNIGPLTSFDIVIHVNSLVSLIRCDERSRTEPASNPLIDTEGNILDRNQNSSHRDTIETTIRYPHPRENGSARDQYFNE